LTCAAESLRRFILDQGGSLISEQFDAVRPLEHPAEPVAARSA
jgi:hypothetical protein